MYVYRLLVFLFLHLIVLSVVFMFFFEILVYTRTADQNVTSPTSTQHTAHSTAQSNQLCTGSFCHYQIASGTNHGLLVSTPFIFSCILPCASLAGGVSRPRSGALVRQYQVRP